MDGASRATCSRRQASKPVCYSIQWRRARAKRRADARDAPLVPAAPVQKVLRLDQVKQVQPQSQQDLVRRLRG